ncbi:hypothetical protein G7068_06485 [Leucobacter viscericola]|uniref:Polyketide cyclase / dehydrase and lipid transport n=1 Tax=Leucobacter viscericola TaxID=2714935 RepID=A0A6G7XEB1_9MICO|nr:SRPBCC family protein [Leucobacter viscericola]QIK62883.1 hypothetical protein G7068_06485 [Leucobacter viscericola]
MIELASATHFSSAPPSDFFARWIDHSSWAEWDPDTEWVSVEGPVREGALGVMKPRGGPKVKFEIFECEQDRVYTDVSRMPGTKLTFRHSVTPVEGGSEVAIRVWLEGPLSRLWARTAFKDFDVGAISSLDRLVALVEAEAEAEAKAKTDAPAPTPTPAQK